MSEQSLFTKVKVSFLQMFTGNIFFTLCSFIAGYFFAKVLGPELYGTWQTAVVFLGYSALFSLSLPFVMRRDFIQLRSQGKVEDANKMAYQVFSYSLVVSPIFVLGIVFYGFYFIENRFFEISLYTVALIYLFDVIGSFGDILTKGFNNYNILKWASIIKGAFLLVSVFFVLMWGYYGLLVGFITSAFFNAIFYYFNRPIAYKWYWNWRLLKNMVLIAIPLYLQQIVQIVFTSIDRLIIASQLSFEQVGYYSLSTLVKTPITLMVSSLSIVLFTQLNETHGASKEPSVIKLHMDIPQILLSYFIPVFIVIGIIALPVITELFLPKYIPGIKAAQIFVFAVFFLLLAAYSSNALFILNKQWYAALAFLIAGIIKTIGSFWAINSNFGIEGVAVSTLIAYIIYDMLMVYYVYRIIELSKTVALKYILRKNIPVLIILVEFITISYLISSGSNVMMVLLKEFVFIVMSIPILYFGLKRLRHLERKENKIWRKEH